MDKETVSQETNGKDEQENNKTCIKIISEEDYLNLLKSKKDVIEILKENQGYETLRTTEVLLQPTDISKERDKPSTAQNTIESESTSEEESEDESKKTKKRKPNRSYHIVYPQSRKLIWIAHKFFKREAENDTCFPSISKYLERTSKAVKLSENVVEAIVNDSNTVLNTTGDNQKDNYILKKLQYQTKDIIKNIYKFFKEEAVTGRIVIPLRKYRDRVSIAVKYSKGTIVKIVNQHKTENIQSGESQNMDCSIWSTDDLQESENEKVSKSSKLECSSGSLPDVLKGIVTATVTGTENKNSTSNIVYLPPGEAFKSGAIKQIVNVRTGPQKNPPITTSSTTYVPTPSGSRPILPKPTIAKVAPYNVIVTPANPTPSVPCNALITPCNIEITSGSMIITPFGALTSPPLIKNNTTVAASVIKTPIMTPVPIVNTLLATSSIKMNTTQAPPNTFVITTATNQPSQLLIPANNICATKPKQIYRKLAPAISSKSSKNKNKFLNQNRKILERKIMPLIKNSTTSTSNNTTISNSQNKSNLSNTVQARSDSFKKPVTTGDVNITQNKAITSSSSFQTNTNKTSFDYSNTTSSKDKNSSYKKIDITQDISISKQNRIPATSQLFPFLSKALIEINKNLSDEQASTKFETNKKAPPNLKSSKQKMMNILKNTNTSTPIKSSQTTNLFKDVNSNKNISTTCCDLSKNTSTSFSDSFETFLLAELLKQEQNSLIGLLDNEDISPTEFGEDFNKMVSDSAEKLPNSSSNTKVSNSGISTHKTAAQVSEIAATVEDDFVKQYKGTGINKPSRSCEDLLECLLGSPEKNQTSPINTKSINSGFLTQKSETQDSKIAVPSENEFVKQFNENITLENQEMITSSTTSEVSNEYVWGTSDKIQTTSPMDTQLSSTGIFTQKSETATKKPNTSSTKKQNFVKENATVRNEEIVSCSSACDILNEYLWDSPEKIQSTSPISTNVSSSRSPAQISNTTVTTGLDFVKQFNLSETSHNEDIITPSSTCDVLDEYLWDSLDKMQTKAPMSTKHSSIGLFTEKNATEGSKTPLTREDDFVKQYKGNETVRNREMTTGSDTCEDLIECLWDSPGKIQTTNPVNTKPSNSDFFTRHSSTAEISNTFTVEHDFVKQFDESVTSQKQQINTSSHTCEAIHEHLSDTSNKIQTTSPVGSNPTNTGLSTHISTKKSSNTSDTTQEQFTRKENNSTLSATANENFTKTSKTETISSVTKPTPCNVLVTPENVLLTPKNADESKRKAIAVSREVVATYLKAMKMGSKSSGKVVRLVTSVEQIDLPCTTASATSVGNCTSKIITSEELKVSYTKNKVEQISEFSSKETLKNSTNTYTSFSNIEMNNKNAMCNINKPTNFSITSKLLQNEVCNGSSETVDCEINNGPKESQIRKNFGNLKKNIVINKKQMSMITFVKSIVNPGHPDNLKILKNIANWPAARIIRHPDTNFRCVPSRSTRKTEELNESSGETITSLSNDHSNLNSSLEDDGINEICPNVNKCIANILEGSNKTSFNDHLENVNSNLKSNVEPTDLTEEYRPNCVQSEAGRGMSQSKANIDENKDTQKLNVILDHKKKSKLFLLDTDKEDSRLVLPIPKHVPNIITTQEMTDAAAMIEKKTQDPGVKLVLIPTSTNKSNDTQTFVPAFVNIVGTTSLVSSTKSISTTTTASRSPLQLVLVPTKDSKLAQQQTSFTSTAVNIVSTDAPSTSAENCNTRSLPSTSVSISESGDANTSKPFMLIATPVFSTKNKPVIPKFQTMRNQNAKYTFIHPQTKRIIYNVYLFMKAEACAQKHIIHLKRYRKRTSAAVKYSERTISRISKEWKKFGKFSPPLSFSKILKAENSLKMTDKQMHSQTKETIFNVYKFFKDETSKAMLTNNPALSLTRFRERTALAVQRSCNTVARIVNLIKKNGSLSKQQKRAKKPEVETAVEQPSQTGIKRKLEQTNSEEEPELKK